MQKNLNIPILQLFILFVFVFEYFTLFEYIRIVSVFTNSIRIRIRFKLQNEYYSVFVFVPKSLFVPTLSLTSQQFHLCPHHQWQCHPLQHECQCDHHSSCHHQKLVIIPLMPLSHLADATKQLKQRKLMRGTQIATKHKCPELGIC